MPDRIVISDASTLIGLANIDCLKLLQKLYLEVEITSIVKDEVGLNLPGFITINDTYSTSKKFSRFTTAVT